MKTLTTRQKSLFSRGFDRGNYANAYETPWYSEAKSEIRGRSDLFLAGHILGFFSSYEIYEIPALWQDRVERYREQFKDLIGE